MGIRALERRLRRQGSKGALKPRTVQRRLNKERIEEPAPPPPMPVRTLTAKQGGKVDSGGSTAEIKTVKNGLATYKYVYNNPTPSEKVDVEMFQDQVKRKYSDGGKV